jgi:ABC-2 type transport system ATP-binding protein
LTLQQHGQKSDVTTSSEAISVEHLLHSYNGKDYVVNDVSFRVKTGEIFGLLGKNGAGKSTTIKILTTLLRPSKGKISVLGHDVMKEGQEVRKRIGVVQQEVSFEFSSVKENIDLYGFLWRVPKDIREKRRDELLKIFGLEDLQKTPAMELSGGQKRRVQVAREFVHDMDLLFLDEPTVGLDPVMRRRILDLLKDKAKRDNLTIFFTTHNLEEADYLCDRIAIMDKGRLLALDTAENLKRIYGEAKAIELMLSTGPDGSPPSYENLFARLKEIHPDLEISKQPGVSSSENNEPAIIISKNPEKVIQSIIEIASTLYVKIEWLNVRKSTLEDVFIQTVSKDDDGDVSF